MDNKIFIKYSNPTHHDKEPYGTICYVVLNETTQLKFKQTSLDPATPDWEEQDICHDLWGIEFNRY